jgi:thiamine-phosphate pyrophosphorylase
MTTRVKARTAAPLHAIRGLYAITPDIADTTTLLEATRAALHGGARVVQYRNKRADKLLAFEQALALRALTLEIPACLIINDDPELAFAVQADGVHLGRKDITVGSLPVLRARAANPRFIIGVSCYDQVARGLDAAAAGADYVAFGSFYPSSTKPGAIRAELSLLHEARRHIDLPIVAIGGVTVDNAARLVEAGADAIAVISALFDSADISATAKQFTSIFRDHVR